MEMIDIVMIGAGTIGLVISLKIARGRAWREDFHSDMTGMRA